ncbi:MAG TPA: MFS transporter [Victivallales bacterium]|nr:MFS transporter [Victivallales bacterium]
MKYNIRRWNPFLIAVPDFGIGVFWALCGTIAPWIIYQHTQSAAKVGILISMGALTGCFVQVISGILSDKTKFSKWGKRSPWILLGATVAAVSQIFWAFAPNYAVLFILAFITYFAVNFYQGPYYTMVMEVVDHDQIGFANSLARTTAQIGVTAISFIAAFIWFNGGAFVSCLIIALFIMIPTLCIIPFTLKERPENFTTQTSYKISFDFIKFPKVLQLYLAAFFVWAGYGCLVPMLTPYFSHYLHFTKDNIGMAMTLYGFASICYGAIASKLNDKMNKKKVFLCAATVFLAAIFMGNFITDSTTALYIFISLAGIGFLATQIATYTLLPEVAPKERLGEFQGLLNMFISLSQVFILIIMGEWIEYGGAKYMYPVATILVFLAIIIMLPNIKGKNDVNHL